MSLWHNHAHDVRLARTRNILHLSLGEVAGRMELLCKDRLTRYLLDLHG